MDISVNERVGFEFDRKAFGARLGMLRRSRMVAERLGLPRVLGADMANAIGILKVRYHRYERGAMEPPISIVAAIADVTGVSLDWLLLGRMREGIRPIEAAITTGDRLKWIREECRLLVEQCAGDFGIDPAMWRAYEGGAAEIPSWFAKEVARRFPITLDYLYMGDVRGLEPQVQHALLTAHPELRQAPEPNKPGTLVPRIGFGPLESPDSHETPLRRGSPASAGTRSAFDAPSHERNRRAPDADSIVPSETD